MKSGLVTALGDSWTVLSRAGESSVFQANFPHPATVSSFKKREEK